MSLATAVDNLYTLLSDLSGLKRAFSNPPESINEYPALIVYAERGEYEDNAAGGRSMHMLVAEIYFDRRNLADTVDAAVTYPDLVFAKLQGDRTLNGAVSHMGRGGAIFRYRMLARPYANELRFVARFEIDVKINE